MEKKKLTEYIDDDGSVIFDFTGFDEVEDFGRIMNIIEKRIEPETLQQGCGFGTMKGVFMKDGISIDVWFDSILGNYFEYSGEKSKETMAKIRRWAHLVFSSLTSIDPHEL